MSPTPPHPDNAADETRTIEDEIQDYEAEGWQVGFAVQFNGVGRAMPDGEASNSGDESDFPDTDPDTDAEADQQYAGYQSIPAEVGTTSDGEADQHSSDNEEDMFTANETSPELMETTNCSFSGSNCSSTDPVVMEKVKKMVGSLSKPKDSCTIEHKPVDICLDSGKMDEIRNAMVGFHLAPPVSWTEVPDDEQIRKLVNNLTT